MSEIQICRFVFAKRKYDVKFPKVVFILKLQKIFNICLYYIVLSCVIIFSNYLAFKRRENNFFCFLPKIIQVTYLMHDNLFPMHSLYVQCTCTSTWQWDPGWQDVETQPAPTPTFQNICFILLFFYDFLCIGFVFRWCRLVF
jgi:hypothetical protein